MQAFRFLNLAILSTLVASSAVLYAQDEKPQEEKPPRQEEPKRQDGAKPASRHDEMKPPRQEEAKPEKQEQKRDEKQSREQMNNGRQEPAQQQGYGRQEPTHQQEGHARPAGKGGHIPDDRFHAQFGREHRFKVQRPVEVEGGQGFVYGGYSFVLVDAWPPDWAYTDDCYVDYIDGEYFLIDMFHPGMRLALIVVM